MMGIHQNCLPQMTIHVTRMHYFMYMAHEVVPEWTGKPGSASIPTANIADRMSALPGAIFVAVVMITKSHTIMKIALGGRNSG